MRPQLLTFQAFGSYPGTHTIDFASLGARGLFLVTGPTGTGKTTVFDAMVYALYGRLPGGRSANDYKPRSHHAAADVETFVEFEFEAGGQRYVVRRTPTWERPRKRGEGMTSEAGKATLARLHGTGSTSLATQPREVDTMCRQLVGLDATQFQRVVLLPQGKFTDFLLAQPEIRKELLSELFGGGLYQAATEWLKREKGRLDEAVRDADVRVEHQRSNAITALDTVLAIWPAAERDPEPTDQQLADLIAALEPERVRSAAEATEAERVAQAAQAQTATAVDAAQRFDDAVRHRGTLAACEGERPHIEAARSTLAESLRAQPVVTLAQRVRTTEAAKSSAGARHEELRRELGECFEAMGRPSPSFDAGAVSKAVAELATGVATDDQLLRAVAEQNSVSLEAAEKRALLEAQLDDGTVALVAAGDRVDGLRAEAGELADLAGTVPAREAELIVAGERLARRAELDELSSKVAPASKRADDAKAEYEATMAAFVATQAPRLAEALAPGEACPVCGSTEHPEPAQLGSQRAVDHVEVDEARSVWSARQGEEQNLQGQIRAITDALGGDAAQPVNLFEAAVADATAAFDSAQAAATRLSALQHELDSAEAEKASVDQQVRELHAKVAAATATAEGEEAEAVRRRGLVEGLDTAELEMRRGQLQVLRGIEPLVGGVVIELEQASTSHRDACAALADSLPASGYSTEAEAEAAVLADARQAELSAEVKAWDDRWSTASNALTTLEQLGVPPVRPEAEALASAASIAAAAHRDAVAAHTTASNALDAAGTSLSQSQREAADSAEVRAQRDVATVAFKTCNGEAGIRVKLEAWVLAAELDRVTAAANVHLSLMSKGRYRIQRESGRSALGLEVFDANTGRTRTTTSLSGGEQFQASLSLALGLADVVSHGGTASGKRFEALFVDEGFGSLDPQALDQAIEALSHIHEGGRMVGAITHVEAMKERLHVGIEVSPNPDGRGSTLTVKP